MGYGDSDTLLLVCVRRALGLDIQLNGEPVPISAGSDWPRPITLAERHDIVPLLNVALRDSAAVPVRVRRQLEARSQTVLAHNLALAAELAEIQDLFERSGVNAIPFKGPAWTKALYGNLAYRQIRDLDILVDRSDIGRASEILAERGYAAAEQSKAKRPAQSKDIEWVHSRTGIHLELHWSACEPWYDRRLSRLKLWEPASATMLAGRKMPLPTVENMFFLLAIHGARHRWEALKWLCDVAALFKTFPELDFAQVLSRASELSRRRIVLLPCALVSRLFQVALPPALLKAIRQDPGVEALAGEIQRRYDRVHDYDPASARASVARLFDQEGLRIRMRDRRIERIRLRTVFLANLVKPNLNDRAAYPRCKWSGLLCGFLRPYRLMRAYGPATFLKLARQFMRSA